MGKSISSKKIKSLAVILAISLILIIVGVVVGLDDCGTRDSNKNNSSAQSLVVGKTYSKSTTEGKEYEYSFESESNGNVYIYVTNASIDSIYCTDNNGYTRKEYAVLVGYDYAINGTNYDRLYRISSNYGYEYEITFVAEGSMMKFIIS